jgi:hypothetical protein
VPVLKVLGVAVPVRKVSGRSFLCLRYLGAMSVFKVSGLLCLCLRYLGVAVPVRKVCG